MNDLVALLHEHKELTLTPAMLVIFYLLWRIERRLFRLELLTSTDMENGE